MKRFSYHARSGLVAVCGLLLGGCVGTGARHASNPDRPPAMPTIAPGGSGSAWVSRPNEAEVIAAASQAARAGDVNGFRRALSTMLHPIRRSELAEKILLTLSEEDPRTAAQLGVGWAESALEVSLVGGLARTWARREADDALRWAFGLPDNATARVARSGVVGQLVSSERRDAITRIENLPAGPLRDDLLVQAAGAWGRIDPNAAIAWVRGIPDSELRPRLISSVGFGVAHTRPDRALEVAEMLPQGRDRSLLISAIGQTWVAVDSKAALAWAGKLPAGESRDAAFAGIDTGYGVPVSRRIASGPGTRGSYRTRGGAAAVVLPTINSPDFAAWLALQRPGLSYDEAILEYVRQKGALQPGAVAPFIESLPPGVTRDQASSLYVDGLLLSSPARAAEWVGSLPRSERSDELMEKTARRWLLTNPDAAADWIQQSTLPQHRKDELLRDAGKR